MGISKLEIEATEGIDTADANCRELLDVVVAQGLETVVVSPGSRNTPLLIGVHAREELRKVMITDERTAGFAALGMAMVSRKPVGLICTSGTALYNYAPAVAEAYYQKVPLIVITADRPLQWIDQDDSQTLRQFGALSGIVKKSFDIPTELGMSTPCRNPEYETEREWYVNRIANEAYLTAVNGQPGPVHINMQFGNPLNGLVSKPQRSPRIIREIRNDSSLPPHRLRELCEQMLDKKIMLVAGTLPPDNKLNKAVREFDTLKNVTLICETTSNLHPGGLPYMADSLLTRMSKEKLNELRPDLVISIGGALVSRMLKEYLRECKDAEHWTLADTDVNVDCFQRLTTHIDVSPDRFLHSAAGMTRHLIRKGKKEKFPNYHDDWDEERLRIKREDETRIRETGWCELSVMHSVLNNIPKNFNLFLSNGTCVRYAQLLMETLPHACYSNRGVSGIDGTNATALGAAMDYKEPTLLVTGDMSFSYCPEVMNYKETGADLRILVINNRGGGIFRFIKTTRNLPMRDEYFCCDHPLPLEGLAKAYGWNYHRVSEPSTLEKAMKELFLKKSTIVEVVVEPEESAKTLIDWLENIEVV